jgi:hypothetical protein
MTMTREQIGFDKNDETGRPQQFLLETSEV